MNNRNLILIAILIVTVAILFNGCSSYPSRQLNITFHTFQNLKPDDGTNLYPEEIKQIAHPFEVENKNVNPNLIFDEIKLRDQLNNANVSISIKNSADGNIDMNNINGVTDRIEALFSDLKIDNSLKADSSKSFDYDTYFEMQTRKPNFFIFYSTEPNFKPKHPAYIGVNDLRQAIEDFLVKNDSINTVIVAYNPGGNKSIEEIKTPKAIVDNKPKVIKPEATNKSKKQKNIKKITQNPSAKDKKNECANLIIEKLEIQHEGDSKDFTWQKIKCAEKILFSIKTKNGGQGQVFTRALNGDASSFTCPKSGSGEISNKKHIVTIQAFDKNKKLIAKGERNDCYITCQ